MDKSYVSFHYSEVDITYLVLYRLNMIVLRHSFKRKVVISRHWLTAVETKKLFMLLLDKTQAKPIHPKCTHDGLVILSGLIKSIMKNFMSRPILDLDLPSVYQSVEKTVLCPIAH